MLRQINIPSTIVDLNSHRLVETRDRVGLMGVGVDRVSFDAVLDRIGAFIRDETPRRIVTVNLDYLRLAARDEAFRGVLNGADLAVADGMPLVWASSLAGARLPQRVTGLDLFDAICKRAASRGWSVFLLGAAPNVAERAAVEMIWRHRGLKVVGAYAPPIGPFDAAEDERIRGLIEAAAPDVLFVAFGAPRQDVWISENLAFLRVPVSIGVGCAFDVASGNIPRAPRWMRRTGLEWLFRLSREPGRLWRRYLLGDVPAFFALVLSSIRRRGRGRPIVLDPGEEA